MRRGVFSVGLAALAVAAIRCYPDPLDLTGKLCSADRPCGDGYYCFQGACQPGNPPAPANLLQNPDFESIDDAGNFPHWHPAGQTKVADQVRTVHDGGRALELLSLYDGGFFPRVASDSLLDAGRYLFCANVWIYALDAGMHATLNLSARYDGGQTTLSGNTSTVTPPPGVWTELSANLDTTQSASLPDAVNFQVTTSAFYPASNGLIIDDAWLWRPLDTCP